MPRVLDDQVFRRVQDRVQATLYAQRMQESAGSGADESQRDRVSKMHQVLHHFYEDGKEKVRKLIATYNFALLSMASGLEMTLFTSIFLVNFSQLQILCTMFHRSPFTKPRPNKGFFQFNEFYHRKSRNFGEQIFFHFLSRECFRGKRLETF